MWSGALGIFRSLDGGLTWTSPSQTGPNRVQIHVDEHFFAFTPDGSKLYIANDGGIFSTTDVTAPAAQVNWTNLGGTLAITQFYPGISIDPANPSNGLGGTQDNGTQQYSGSANWSTIVCGDGGYTLIDPLIPSLRCAAVVQALP